MKTCFFLAAVLLAGCGGGTGGGAPAAPGGAPATSAGDPVAAAEACPLLRRTALLGRDADSEPVADVALALVDGVEPRPLD